MRTILRGLLAIALTVALAGAASADSIYVHVTNGVVDNRAVFPDSGLPQGWPDASNWIASDQAQIGWQLSGGALSAPPTVPVQPSTNPADYPLQRYQFLAMLKIAGLQSVATTAIASISDPTQQAVAQAKYDSAQVFFWGDPTTQLLIGAAVSAGGITQQQAVAYWLQAKGL